MISFKGIYRSGNELLLSTIPKKYTIDAFVIFSLLNGKKGAKERLAMDKWHEDR